MYIEKLKEMFHLTPSQNTVDVCNQLILLIPYYFISRLVTLLKVHDVPIHMRREEKPTRCHCMLYCSYDTLNMFRAFLCPSSGAVDYMYASAAYGVQCLAAGCRGSGA